MKICVRIVAVCVIIAMTSLLLLGSNNKDSRQLVTTKFQKMVERKGQKSPDQKISHQKDNRRLSAGRTEPVMTDAKIRKNNADPGARIARHQERISELQASGATDEQVRQILAKEKITSGTGSISGLVYESDGVTPLENYCYVYVYNEYGYYIDNEYLSTGDTGYVINEIPAGSYYVMTRSNYYFSEYYENVTDWREATLVQVTDGQETSGIDFSLEKSKVITGHVYEEDGTIPITDMRIRLYLYDANAIYDTWDYSSYSTYLDEDGRYFIRGGSDSRAVKLKAMVEGYGAQFYNNADTWYDATAISLMEANDTIPDINFSLSPVIAVQDGYEQNNHYSAAYEICYGDTVKPQINPENDLDYFKFNGQEGDTVTIEIFADIYGSWLDSYLLLIDSSGTTVLEDNDDFDWSLDSKIENYALDYTGLYFIKVRDLGDDGGINYFYSLTINLGTAHPESLIGAISGRIYQPDGITPYIGSASIDAYDAVTGDWIEDDYISNSDSGLYTISGLPSGDYKINVDPYDDIYLEQYYNGVHNWEDAAIVSVIVPDTTRDIDFTLEYGGFISGRVHEPDGITPFIGTADVEAYDAITGDWIEDDYISNSDSGLYTISGLPSGDYKVNLYNYGDDRYSDQWYNGMQYSEDATVVSVNVPDTTRDINFTQIQGGTIRGFICSGDGSERISSDSIEVMVVFYDSATGKYADNAYNTFAGGYKTDCLWPGSYKVAAIGMYNDIAPVYYGGGTVYDDPDNAAVTITSGEVKDINFNVTASSGKISGIVYDPDGNPYTDIEAVVIAYDLTGHFVQVAYVGWNVNTGEWSENGEYMISGLLPGNYYLALVDESNDEQLYWYNNIVVELQDEDDFFAIDVPSNAIAVTVHESEETPDIDFYLGGTGIDKSGSNGLPSRYGLSQNFPNPFNPVTTFRYAIPQKSNVTLTVYNITGRLIKTLVHENKEPGYYAVNWNASQLSSGIYLYQLRAGDFRDVKKCLLIK